MCSFLHQYIWKITLVLIIASLFIVYNSHARDGKGPGQQKPAKIAGLLAANLISFDGVAIPGTNISSHTVEP